MSHPYNAQTKAAASANDRGLGGPRATKYVWLAYTAFLFIDPVLSHSRALWEGTLLVFAIFLALYSVFFSVCNKRLKVILYFAFVLLGASTVPWNSGGMTFMIYAACFLPFIVVPLRLVLAGFAFQVLVLCAEAQWLHTRMFHVSWVSVAINSLLMLLIGGSNVFFAQQRRADKKLHMKQEEIEALAAVAERERIARDLHDVLGHTLSLIVLKSELAGRLISKDPGRASAEIADVERTARSALAEVREAIGGYRSRGLAAEIESARTALAAAGVNLHAEAVDLHAARLSPAEETVLALALREAVTNIVRHAHAHTCTLRFSHDAGTHRLIVEDDGQHADLHEGNGLRGMRERVEAIGGRLSLVRDPGTRLEVNLPAAQPGAALA